MTTVVIAVDETDASVRAIHVARRLFGDDARYVVVHVADEMPVTPVVPMGTGTGVGTPMWSVGDVIHPVGSGDAGGMDVDAVELAESVARRVAAAGDLVRSEAVGALGDPAEAILGLARHRDAEVVVIGAHRHGWFTRTFGSSVADDLRKQAHVPVLLVPETATS
jgi:nucleotide-binding universal stress UspA family protein